MIWPFVSVVSIVTVPSDSVITTFTPAIGVLLEPNVNVRVIYQVLNLYIKSRDPLYYRSCKQSKNLIKEVITAS